MRDDLQRRLRRLDDVPAPDLWSRVGVERGRPPTQPTRIRRVAISLTALAVAAAAFVFFASTFRAGPPNEQARVLSLPNDACALLTREQVAAATESAVLSAGEVTDERSMWYPLDPPCAYETDSRFGQVTVWVGHGRQAFVDARDRDPTSTQRVDGIGDEAFVYAKASLWVLVGDGAFSIDTQLGAGDGGVAILEILARDALANLATPATAFSAAELDPTAICDVPAYDPDVAMLGDGFTGVFGEEEAGLRTFPLDVLEAPGESGSSIRGTATDSLRSYLASPDARYAPGEGWRTIDETDGEVLFAAPDTGGSTRWWVIRFEQENGIWRQRETEIVDQFRTPAQRGHGLALSWTGEVTLSDGSWASELTLRNESAETWSDDEQTYGVWGSAHVFDPGTGLEVGHSAESVGDWGAGRALASGEDVNVPLSLGGQLTALEVGTYEVVACVPRLGLASPVGSLLVVDAPTTTTSVRVLTYPTLGGGMEALGGGVLVDHHGCLAVAHVPDDPRPSYVLWPDGYALVTRDGRTVLIDAVGNEIAAMGDEVRLGGGNTPLEGARGAIGGIPESCQTGGESYFITSGPA